MDINIEALASVGLLGNIYTPDNLKKAYIRDWQKNPTSINYCLEEINKGKATGYAVVTGNDGLIALDFDGKNANRIVVEALPWAIELTTLTWSSGKSNRKGKIFRIPEDRRQEFAHITKRSIKSYTNIKECPSESLEVSYRRSKVTLPPSAHPETDGYKWVNFVPIHELNDNQCDSLLELLRTSYEKNEPIKQYTLTDIAQRDKAIALEALEYISPDLEYEGWIKVGTALKNMSFEFSVWDSWSSKGEKYAKTNTREMERKWQGFNNTKLSIQTILHYAEGYKQTQSKIYTHTDKPIIKNKIETNKKKVDKKSDKNRIKGMNLSDFIEAHHSDNREYLINAFLPKGEMIMLHGDSGTGKTRLMMDLAYAMLTSDGKFLGENVEQGKIAFVAPDQSGWNYSDSFLKRGFLELENLDNVKIYSEYNIKEIKQLEAIIEDSQPDLIVFDSLTGITAECSVDENKAEFVKLLIPVIKLLEKENISSVVIHHDNKNPLAKGRDKASGTARLKGRFHAVWSLTGIDDNAPKKLVIKDRSAPNSEHKLKFHSEEYYAERGFFEYLGEIGFSNEAKGQTQQIIYLLDKYSDGLTRKEIESFLPEIQSLSKVLSRALASKQIKNKLIAGKGKKYIYYLPKYKVAKNSTTVLDNDENNDVTINVTISESKHINNTALDSDKVTKHENLSLSMSLSKKDLDNDIESDNSLCKNNLSLSKSITNTGKGILDNDIENDNKKNVTIKDYSCNNNSNKQKTKIIEIDWKQSLKELEVLFNKKKLISKKSRLMFVKEYFGDRFIKSVHNLTNEQILSLLSYLRIKE